MKKIWLDDIEVTLDISFKNNKNTYFRFLPNHCITVTTSTFQTEDSIILFIQRNKPKFIKKLIQMDQKTTQNKEHYYLFGVMYKKVYSKELNFITFDHDKKCVYLPDIAIDLLEKKMQKLEKELLLHEVDNLVETYKNNHHVSLKNVTFKTRAMISRYGSCNKVTRRINLNLKLVHLDKLFLEYVFTHEIAHLTYANHKQEFYDLVAKLYPNYKEVRKELRQINIR